MACELGAVDRVRRDGVRCGGATGVAGVKTEGLKTKGLKTEKPNAPDCSEASVERSGEVSCFRAPAGCDAATMPEAAP